jgi:O-antigen ligase
MSAWLTPQSLAALFVTVVFVGVALLRPSRAVLAYAVLGAAPPLLQLGAFSGRTISQGLLLAEALATVLFGAWLTRRETSRLFREPVDGPLFAFLAVCCASMAGIVLLPDTRIAHTASLTVSFGQLLLVLWPIGVYLAAAEFLKDTGQLRWLQRAIIGLAITQLVLFVVPEAWIDYLGWTMTFGLFAAPFALAAVFTTRSPIGRLLLIFITVLPFLRGVQGGKAFLYGYVATAVLTVLWLRAQRLGALLAGLGFAAVLVGVVLVGDEVFIRPMEVLLNKERSQMSFGGASGRGALAVAALSIWEQAPFLGVGPGNSYIYMLQRSPIGTPHNQYLNILVEFGIVGLAVWIWFLVVAGRTGLRIYREATHPVHRTFALGWLGMFAGMVVGGITGDFMVHSVRNGGLELFSGYYLQWVLLGGLMAIPRIEQRLLEPDTTAPARPRFWRATAHRQLAQPAAAQVTRRPSVAAPAG